MACEEVAHSRPLFLTIYTIVIVGIVFSSLYVFSAIRYPSTNASTWSLSSTLFHTLIHTPIASVKITPFLLLPLNVKYPFVDFKCVANLP